MAILSRNLISENSIENQKENVYRCIYVYNIQYT